MDIYEEKARELIYSMSPINFSEAKKCALVAVNEILKNIDATMMYIKDHKALLINKDYWIQVKSKLNTI